VSDQDLFVVPTGIASTVVQPNVTASVGTQDHGLLGVLVGEGRKYKDMDALVKGHLHADDHIARLEEENRTLREQGKSAATVEDVLKRLQEAGKSGEKTLVPPVQPATTDIAEIVRKTVTGLETEKVRQGNRARVQAAMKELFGDKAKEVFEKEAATAEQRAVFTQLAEVDPARFIAMFKPADKPMPGAMQSTVSSTSFGSSPDRTSDPGTKEYWNEMRRKEPKKYYSAENQLAKDKAAQANPDKYFGRTT
jgi:hypothetical protein